MPNKKKYKQGNNKLSKVKEPKKKLVKKKESTQQTTATTSKRTKDEHRNDIKYLPR